MMMQSINTNQLYVETYKEFGIVELEFLEKVVDFVISGKRF
jgi:hypothetical protein